MIQFVLDTDIVGLLQHGHPVVTEHVGTHNPEEVATTIITVEEQLSGWYTLLRRARTASQLVPVYQRMAETVRFLASLPILSFTDAAAEVYEQFQKKRPRTGRMDLRIASIAASNNATLVTRNLGDFKDIDGLAVEDWSST
ncbi:MAG: type II toxin-antitoxin system VapC family toxin [Planctomycetota bacterium]|jgi:tRNA(fMet)-specific endonuclease VapC|nr:type II toxin-antitoxin system VapC family toxin [Planctomycetota bacterium]MDP7129950.1 type II toxin-antitoxin system VapC family toxin [Planctomycetota bacterium]MDP7253327.1 type II toxin-antitoxin system VapC family toxin [Planctomycetota bacterium]